MKGFGGIFLAFAFALVTALAASVPAAQAAEPSVAAKGVAIVLQNCGKRKHNRVTQSNSEYLGHLLGLYDRFSDPFAGDEMAAGK